MSIAYTPKQDALRVLGPMHPSLKHPMFEDIMVLNGWMYTVIWLDDDMLWTGVFNHTTDKPKLDKLKELYPALTVSVHPLEAGIHF